MHCCTPRLSGADESEHPKPGERVICTLLPDYKQKSIKHHKIQVFGKRCSVERNFWPLGAIQKLCNAKRGRVGVCIGVKKGHRLLPKEWRSLIVV